MFMLPGMPFVYYGEEIGMIGTKPDETIRTPMQWSAASNGGFTTGTAWESLQPDWMTKTVAAQDPDSGSLLNHYRRLIHFRNAHAALSHGSLAVGTTSDAAGAAFVRATSDETILIALNFGERAIERFGIALSSAAGSGGGFRLEALYADPANGCEQGTISVDGKSVIFNSIAAHSLCAFRLSR